MLLSQVEPTYAKSTIDDMNTIKELFNGSPDILEKRRLSSSESFHIPGAKSSIRTVLLVCLLVFLSLMAESPSRFPDINKLYLYIATSLLAGFIVWMFQLKIN
jgi:hypothetical protein